MKSCELCKSPARIYCESDQASLCWDCDAKVHSANFLVARHSRSVLCHVCQSPTAWNASGEKLGRTISVCARCVEGSDGMKEESQGGNDDEIDTEDDYDDEGDDDVDDEDQVDFDDEDGDNQVVPTPWSSLPPPPSASSSSSEESSTRFSNGDGDVSSKRMRENVADLCSDNDLGCSSSERNNVTPLVAAARSTEAEFVDSLSLRLLKTRRIEANESNRVQQKPAGSRSASIVESLERFLHQDKDVSSGNDLI